MGATCPSENTEATDQSSFLDGTKWDDHKIGWAIAGGCAAVVRCLTNLPQCAVLTNMMRRQTVLVTMISVLLHCRYVRFTFLRYLCSEIVARNYNNRREQRQMYYSVSCCLAFWHSMFTVAAFEFCICHPYMRLYPSFHIVSSGVIPTIHSQRLRMRYVCSPSMPSRI
jgi:hypothetical protein